MRTPNRCNRSLIRGSALAALVLGLGACTPGGQFDPTTLMQMDMFETKKPVRGDRQPVFPNGVPGATSGVPPELVKGYQPPPEPATTEAAAAPVEPPKPKLKPKRKPKPKVASAPATPPRTEISVGLSRQPAAPPQQPPQTAQSPWPDPRPAATSSAQPAWPSPPSSPAPQPSQSIWPDPTTPAK